MFGVLRTVRGRDDRDEEGKAPSKVGKRDKELFVFCSTVEERRRVFEKSWLILIL